MHSVCTAYVRTLLLVVPLAEILPPSSNVGKAQDGPSEEGDDLPLQETGMEVSGVSEYEMGLAIISNRKREEEARKKAKAARATHQDNTIVVNMIDKSTNNGKGQRAGREGRRSLEPARRNRKFAIPKRCKQVICNK
jgi:hypothetical protein